MNVSSTSAIDLVEAAYDVGATESEWLSGLLEASRDIFDHDLGFAGLVATKPPTPELRVAENLHTVHTLTGPSDFLSRHIRACEAMPQELIYHQTQTGLFSLSGLSGDHPEVLDQWRQHIEGARDAIGVMALDTDGRGVHLIAGLPENNPVSAAERKVFSMMAAHLSAGLRLRSAVTAFDSSSRGDLPMGAEAVLDPSRFNVVDATRGAARASALRSLREAAAQVDRARGRLRKQEPLEALTIWEALVRGRWSMIDWFDTDQRRYMLAVPNPPAHPDPRGLTKRESQVVAYACLGESHKMVAYRLGVSRPTVSNALRSARRKLGVRTQAELVAKFRALERTMAPAVENEVF